MAGVAALSAPGAPAADRAPDELAAGTPEELRRERLRDLIEGRGRARELRETLKTALESDAPELVEVPVAPGMALV